MKLEDLTPEVLGDFSKSEMIDLVMAMVGQVVQLTERENLSGVACQMVSSCPFDNRSRTS